MLEELKEAHQKAWGILMRLLMLIGPFAVYGLLLMFIWFVYPPHEGFALFSFRHSCGTPWRRSFD